MNLSGCIYGECRAPVCAFLGGLSEARMLKVSAPVWKTAALFSRSGMYAYAPAERHASLENFFIYFPFFFLMLFPGLGPSSSCSLPFPGVFSFLFYSTYS